MEKNRQRTKLFLVLFFCTAFIFNVTYFGSQLMGKMNKVTNTSSEEISKLTNNLKTKTTVSQQEENTVLNEATVKLDEIPDDLQIFLVHNSKIEIQPESSFSFLEFAKKQKLSTLNSDTLSMIASGIYQAILPTNFKIEERNIGNKLPAYAVLGYEAKVDSALNEDLVFYNPNKTKYILDLQQNSNILSVDLKGGKLSYDYKISLRDEQQLKTKTIAQYSPMLPSGQTIVTSSGRNGQTVKVYREAYRENILFKSEWVASDYYPPEYRIEVQALATQSAAGTGSTVQSAQQSGTNSSQTNQGTQAASGMQAAATSNSAAQTTTDSSSDLWGSPNEPSK